MDQEVDKVEHTIAENLRSRSNEVKKDRSITYYIGVGLRFIGENTKIVLAVTYGLGATTQVLKLGAIDPAYIRFFSVSQLIADGAFFISLIFLGYISFYAFSLFFKLIGINDFLVSDLKNNHKSGGFLLNAKGFLILLLPFSIFIFYSTVMAGYFNNRIFFMITSCSLIYSVLSEVRQYSYDYDDHTDEITGDKKIGNGAVYRCLLFIATILLIFTIPKFIYDMYNLPPNLDNYDKAKQIVMTDYKSQGLIKEDVDILYFNDKFMFIEVTRPNNERSIAIYQTNSMLFDTRVITLSEE